MDRMIARREALDTNSTTTSPASANAAAVEGVEDDEFDEAA